MWITGARSGWWLQHVVGSDMWAREEGRAAGREPCGQQGTATPLDLKAVGKEYVKGEFRRHKTFGTAFVSGRKPDTEETGKQKKL